MPNHVTNVIQLRGDENIIKELLEAVKNDEHGIGTIDFEKLIPMPESLNIEESSLSEKGLKEYSEFISEYMLEKGITQIDLSDIPKHREDAFLEARKDIEPSEWALGKQTFENKMKYGAASWYDWRIVNWHTKWNAYFFDEPEVRKPNEIRFCTAWSAPHTILQKLSEMYPEITIDHSWADEDIGYNCGAYAYKNGEVIEEYLPTEGEKDALEFAAKLMRYDPQEIFEDEGEEENEMET